MATQKQQRAISIYVENRGELSVSETMRRAGYTEASAKNPKNLTDSQSWQDAMDEYLPDTTLLAKHGELLNSKKIERAEYPGYLEHDTIRQMLIEAGCQPRNFETNPITGIISVWYWAPDARAQAMALNLAYQLKGKMKQKIEHSGEVPVALVEFVGDDSTDQVSQ